jgi:DNA-3-methyladenine glycosylase I
VPASGVMVGEDGVARCWWAGSDPLYRPYHDAEWGRPVVDDVRLFEKLTLEGFQSGLSWLTILRKRENFRRAFAGFDIESVAGFGPDDVTRLLGDAGIVRNRAKIEATIANAKATVALRENGPTLHELIWERFRPAPRATPPQTFADVPSETPETKALAKELKRRGFRFVGPTTLYALMQACGVVDDHLASCPVRLARSAAAD